MSLYIYRRHADDCKVHTLRLPAKAKKFYQDCDCIIWITGTTDNGTCPRQAIPGKIRDWKAGEAYMRSLQAESKDTAVHGPTIAECKKTFLAWHSPNVSEDVLEDYDLVLTRLQVFMQGRNKYHMEDLKVDALELFKTEGMPTIKKNTSRSIAFSKLTFFLRESFRRDWIKEALAEKVTPISAEYEKKQPFEPSEVEAILAACDGPLHGGHTGVGFAGKPATFRLLLELMRETGLRAGDAVVFDPARCTRSKKFWMYVFDPKKQKKNQMKKTCEVYITDDLKTRIDQCEWFSTSHPFAYRPIECWRQMALAVWQRMTAIGIKAEIADCRPHRLRDTFAVELLKKGAMLEDVSKLLCHSSVKVTEKYYAFWSLGRKRSLEDRLFKTLVDS